MYIKIITNWKTMTSSTAPPATLCGTSLVFPSPCSSPSQSSVSDHRGVHIHNHLDDEIFLNLGVLQAGLVGQELPREEPPLTDYLNCFLFLQLFLQLSDGVFHTGCQTHILTWKKHTHTEDINRVDK